MSKILNGQFYTERNVFKNNRVFIKFMDAHDLWAKTIIEPFAGKNNLISFINEIKPIKFKSYDIEPINKHVEFNDSINNWNYGFSSITITNPPYLALHSAKRMKLNIQDLRGYDDLYKLSLSVCLKNSRYVVAIIPTTLITSNRAKDQELIKKLKYFQLLPNKENFDDTEHPVALAYFDNLKNDDDFTLYENNEIIGNILTIKEKEKELLTRRNEIIIKFNKKGGNLSINCGDNTKNKENIRFYDSSFKSDDDVKNTDRHKVKILISSNVSKSFIDKLNNKIYKLRDNKCDYLWASFKGVNKMGFFRKRLDFKTIKKIINSI